MLLWQVQFETLRPLAALPQLICVASERQFGPAYRCVGRHRRHERHCLFKYTLAGEGRFRDAAGEHAVPAGSGFLCEIRDPATAYYYPAGATVPWEFVYVCILSTTAAAMVHDLTARYGPVFRLPPAAPLVAKLLACQPLDGTRPTVAAGEGAAWCFELLTALAAAGGGAARGQPGNELVRRACDWMQPRLAENVNVSELARALRVSREHLTRVFREQTGQSPYRYLRRRKMLLACRLLKDPELTVKEVAARTGGGAPALFTRRFRAELGLAPRQFRRHGVVPIR
jgi:AraC-like DNA-binding protein